MTGCMTVLPYSVDAGGQYDDGEKRHGVDELSGMAGMKSSFGGAAAVTTVLQW